MTRSFLVPIVFSAPLAVVVYKLAGDLGPGLPLESWDLLGLAAFVVVAVIAEAKAVDFRLGPGKEQPHASMAFLPFLGMVALFPAQVTMLAVCGVVAFSQMIVRRHGLARALYNALQGAITVGIAGLVHAVAAPLNWVAAFALGSAVFFVANIVLAGMTIAYLKNASISPVVTHIAGGLKYDVLASPIAVLPIVTYDAIWYSSIVTIFPILVFHSLHIKAQQLVDADTDLIRVLIKAIETRDPYTSGHSMRVSTMAKMIATDLGLPRSQISLVERAALLHDIGKIDPAFAEVLRKPFSLTAEERALIETHAEKGAAMLEGLRSVKPAVVQAVLHHHERFDGKGYPHRIAGQDIPLAARIIMLSDSVDAMLSDRPYRKALSVEAVHAELKRCAGAQFDPAIVQAVTASGTLQRAILLLSADLPQRTGSMELAAVGGSDPLY
jgi:putative nucleotidyltransferase with HDIG domain